MGDDLAVVLGALGEGIYTEQGFALQRLAGPTLEQDEMPDGGLCITFPQGGVAVCYANDDAELVATAVVVYIEARDDTEAYPAPDELIDALPLSTATRSDVASHLGEAVQSGGGFDVFAVRDRFLRFEYGVGGELTKVTAMVNVRGC